MTETDRKKLALPVPDNSIKNDAPPELLRLAKAAIFAGFQRVELAYESLEVHEPSPIGWMMHLAKLDSSNVYAFNSREHAEVDESKIDERMRLRVTTRRKGLIGDGTYTEPDAYVGEETFWGIERILEWISTEHFLTTEVRDGLGLRPGDKLISDEAAQAAYERLEAGYLNGWAVKHELHLDTALPTSPRLAPGELSLAKLSLGIEAINNFFHVAGHPQHHSAGGKLNTSHSLIQVNSQNADFGSDAMLSSYEDYREVESGRVQNFEESRFYQALTNTAPWFVRVAGQVEDDEEAGMDGYWAFAPESRPELG